MNLSVNNSKLVSEFDIVQAAADVLIARDRVLSLGGEISELQNVIDNIQFTRDTIKKNGAKWYIDHCDPDNEFGALFDVNDIIDAKYFNASEEGLKDAIKDLGNKIAEYWHRLVEWVKGLFNKKASEVTKANDEDVKESVAVISELPAEKKVEVEKELPLAVIPKEELKKTTSRWKSFCSACSKAAEASWMKIKEGWVFTINGIIKLKKFLLDIVEALKKYQKEHEDIVGKLVAAKTEDQLNSVIEMSDAFTAKMKAEMAELIKKNDISDDVIDLSSDDAGTYSQFGMKSLTNVTSTVGQLSGTTPIALSFDNLGTACTTDVANVESRLRLTFNGADDRTKQLIAMAIKKIAYEQMLVANMIKHSKELPIVISEFQKKLAEDAAKKAA